MMPGIDPNKMKAIMKQMGIKQEEISANRVVIEKEDQNIIIENPQIIKINMQGNENFQISGDVKVESKEAFNDGDVKLVMEKTGASEGDARKALENSEGDLSEAILNLS